jgi:hypothetical protein
MSKSKALADLRFFPQMGKNNKFGRFLQTLAKKNLNFFRKSTSVRNLKREL